MNRLLTRGLIGMLITGSAIAQPVQDTTSTFEYDVLGNLAKVTDGLQHVTTYSYDALSRRTRTVEPNTGVEIATTYGYDLLDQPTRVTDARNVVTQYVIDGLGNLEKTISGDTGETKNTYDDAGNLKTRTDAKQQVTTYLYDELNRVKLITYHDGATVVYAYDLDPNSIGQLSRVTDASGKIDYAYDGFGRLEMETRLIGGVAHSTAYRYDDAGRLAGMTYPSGRRVGYVRDTLGRVSQVTTTVGTSTVALINSVDYQPFGAMKKVTFGNGRSQSRGYDLDGRVDSFSLPTQTMKIDYDAASNVKSVADVANAAAGTSYGYDLVDRLTNVITPTSAQTYSYDAVGNRKQKINNTATTAYTYGTTNNRLTHVAGLPIAIDANGSATSKGSATLTYDVRGRMISANTAIGQVTYTINSLGQRVRKVTPTETTVFHYDIAGKLIAETTTAGSTVKTQEYVYLGDMPVAVLK